MANAMHFFLGANSPQGFQSLFEEFCRSEDLYDLLILKAGPGAGKSTMMRRIGEVMEERGEQVEYLHCSGDPKSLDGVFFSRIRTAVVDGTAPHIVEPRYPAAVERYVDLGRFCDISASKKHREEIITHSEACSAAYRAAYRMLAAAGKLDENASALVLKGLDRSKLERRTDGIISREIKGKGSGGRDVCRFLGSITCEGEVWRFDSVEKLCQRVYLLLDSAGSGAYMLHRIHKAAQKRHFSSIICYDPEHKERLQHLLIPELGLAFVTSRPGMEWPYGAYRRIHLDALVDADHMRKWKGKIKFMRNMVKTLRGEGVDQLRAAREAHDALEAVYQPYINFDAVNELIQREIDRILSY